MLSFVLTGLVLVGPRTHRGLVASSVSASLFFAFYQGTQVLLIDHNRVSNMKARNHSVSVRREIDLFSSTARASCSFPCTSFRRAFAAKRKKKDEICWADRNSIAANSLLQLGREPDAFLWRQHQDLVSSQCL